MFEMLNFNGFLSRLETFKSTNAFVLMTEIENQINKNLKFEFI